MKKLPMALLTVLCLSIQPTIAVSLDGRGTGEVLIFPYYTVNNQQTLFSIFNSTPHGKALKVRFREGYNGRDVVNFNVYLGAYDAWVGSVFDSTASGTGPAAIASTDESCTVPGFDKTFFPGGAGVLVFSNQNYSQGAFGQPTGTDNGPTTLDRTREGFAEVIEMGEVIDQASGTQHTLESITPKNPVYLAQPDGAVPNSCYTIGHAWDADGYWSINPTLDISPPAGGLYGSAGIVDVAQGTIYSYDATAISGFSDVAQHTGPGSVKPNLSTAVTDSAGNVATAYVPIGTTMIRADYPASTQGIDAVSAVLMAGTVYNEFSTETALGASSDWVLTFPTKQFYVDPAIVGTDVEDALPPFDLVFGTIPAFDSTTGTEGSCVKFGFGAVSRSGEGGSVCDILCPYVPPDQACFETSILSFQQIYTPSNSLKSVLISDYLQPKLSNGQGFAIFDDDGFRLMRPSSQGNTFHGVPSIGFLAVNYINANVMPQVLSNYSATYSHRTTAVCSNASDPQHACH